MKKIIVVSAVFLFILGCTKNLTTLPTQPQQNSSLGKVALNFDKANAPSNVVIIIATLSRDGYDTLSDSLDVVSDSSAASVTINDIPAGGWQLEIDAVDGNNAVIYTGQTNITILAGITEQVSLALNPTGQGSGNINISISWGKTDLQSVLHLDGVSGYVEVPNSPSLSTLDTAITIEAWIKPIDDRYYSTIIDKGITRYGIEFAQGLFPGVYLNGVNAPGANYYWGRIMVPKSVEVNKWLHIAMTYSPSTGVNVYYNEQLVYHTQASGSLSIDNLPLRIGARIEPNYIEYFGGSMDDVRIWKVVRSQDEIIQNMNKSLSGSESGLVADWNFDEIPGPDNVIHDISPNHNDGVIHGGANVVTESAY